MRRFHKVNFVIVAILFIVNILFAECIIKEFKFPANSIKIEYRDGYGLVSLKGCDLALQEVGKPIIPFANLNVLIPPSAEITNIEILDLKRTEIPGEYLLYPAQEPIPTSFQGEKPFISPDVATYQLTSEYPAKITEIIPSGNKSEFRIGGVFLYPVQYIPNQKKLVLYERIKIKINYEKGKHEVQPLTQSQKELFSNEVKTLVINPEDINRFSPPIRVTDNPDADYIILTSSTLESRCTPLVNWIRKTGMWADTFNTTWVSSNYTGRDLQEKIRKFIIDYYTNHGLKYVLLAGDVSVIPQRGAYANVNTSPATIDSFIPCDLYYADLQYSWDGNQNNIFGDNFTISGKKDTVDLYYDVYLGRWPVETSAEIDTMIRKYMTYVKNPDTSYEKRMLLPYGSLWAGYSGKASQDSIANYTPSGWTDRYINNTQVINEVRDSLNNGFGFCHLCGHGNEYGVYWTSSGPDMYTTTYSHPSSQTNYNKLVIANSNACYSGSFDYSDCLAEEMMKARGSAIAVMMNSRYGWGYSTGPIGPSELLDVQFYNYLFSRDSVRIANCHQASKQVYRSSAYSDQLWRWCYCELNLFGEPEMMLWKDNPKKIVAKFSNSIGTGSQSFAVICSSQSTPLSGAIVSLWKGSEVFIHGTTNASGQVNLSINPTSTGYMYVIVTAKNKIPCEDSCNVLNLYLNDVGVDAIIYPTSLHSLNTPVAPIGRVKNYGSSTQTNFQVICSIVGTTSKASTKKIGQGFSFVKSLNDLSMEKVSYQEWTPFNSNEYIIRYIDTLRVTSLAPGETTRVSFRSWTPTFAEMCTVKMRTNLVGDQNSANNLATRITQITATITVISPNGGETLTGGSNKIIKWRTVGYGAYRIILSRNSGSTYTDTIANNVALTETTYNWLVPTLNLNTCRVMVQVLDAGGSVIAQDVSDADFTIDSDPPSVPNLVSPINSAMINNINVSFIWNRSTDNLSGVLRYTLEYARNSGFTNSVDTVVTDSFITLILTDTTYYWHVKAQDRAGNQSSWSSTRSFELDTRIPNAPALVSPINGIWFTNTSVIFNWSQVSFDAKSPVRYILQVDTLTTFTTPKLDTTSLVFDTLTLPQDRYYWRVKAYDLAGNQGTFSSRDSFGIDVTAPSVPNLISPANGAMINNVNVSFIWNRSTDNVSGVWKYTLEYARNSGFTNPTDTLISDTIITLTLTDTTYYWRVKTQDRASNQSVWSSTRSFELDTRIPNAPTLTSPINGIWSTSTEVIFNWSQVTLDAKSPVRYILQVDTTTNFNAPINDTTSYVYDTLVLTQARYYWRVSAYDLAGNQGNFSQRDSFRVDNTTPSVPNLISPANSAMIDNANILFVWNRSTDNLSGISSYILQYAKNSGFTTPRDTIISDTMCTITLTDTTYYWHVKAQDRAGNQSSWSSSRSFEVDTRIPNALTLVSPINGVWLTNTTVIFNWSTVSFNIKSPVRYILEVDTSRVFTNPIVDTTGILYDTLALTQTRYFWRVRAYDLAGNQGAFSGRDSFGVDVTASGIPNLIGPANGSMTNNANITFLWNRSTDNLSGVLRYTLEYARNSGFSNPTDTIVTDTTITLILTDTIYYWRVKSQDRAGNQSSWSSTRSFELDTRIPNAPVLLSPINGIWFNSIDVIFIWSSVTLDAKSAVRYIIQVDTSTTFTSSLTDTTSYLCDTLTLINARYNWRVRAYDLVGNQGAFSNRDSFGADNSAPSVPNLISPANGSMTNNVNVSFIWNRSSDNLSGVLIYLLQYAQNSGFSNPRDTIIPDTMYTITLTDTAYYWHVRAQDRAGNQSGWSSTRSFELDTRVPNAPVLVSPINGIWFTNTSVVFNWSQVTFDAKSPVRYILQVDTLTTFETPNIDTTSLAYDTLTLPQGRYYWRVRAYDLAGNQSIFSGRDSFGIDYIAPSIPNLVSPVNGAVLTDSFVRFTWNRSSDNLSGVRYYRIQIANNSIFVNPIDTLVSDSTIIGKLYDTTYYWRVKSIDRANNESNWSNPRSFNVITTSISENYEHYPTYITTLNALNPNPVTNGRAHISFTLAEPSPVSLKIYDVSGQLIRTLVNTHLQQGIYDYSWNCRDDYNRQVAEGIYFATLETPKQKFTNKLVLFDRK